MVVVGFSIVTVTVVVGCSSNVDEDAAKGIMTEKAYWFSLLYGFSPRVTGRGQNDLVSKAVLIGDDSLDNETAEEIAGAARIP